MKYQQYGRIRAPFKLASSIALAYSISFSSISGAQEIELPRIDIVGREEDSRKKIPGTVDVINQKQLEILQPLSLQDALKTVPGVNVRGDEGGLGAIPNIGIRGLNPSRSQKVLLLEDGAPIAPSLFISNASYYSPPANRMSGIEVLKGASGLKYGPSNIGGVINYLSKTPEDGFKLTGKAGDYGYQLMEIEAGGKSESNGALAGLNIIKSDSQGYQNNGYQMYDILIKGGVEVTQDQWISLKYIHYDNNVNTSYVGLRPNQYASGMTANPAPNDNFLTQRNAVDLNHSWEINSDTKLNSLIYWSQLQRDYWRQSVLGRNANETIYKACSANAECYFGRNRQFNMLGLDSRLSVQYEALGIKNESELGLRLHTETQSNQMVASKTFARSGRLASHEENKANSTALYAQNSFYITDDFP